MAQEDYDNLNAELATGERLAQELAEHMIRMGGAAATTFTVEAGGHKYIVCIEHVSEKANSEG